MLKKLLLTVPWFLASCSLLWYEDEVTPCPYVTIPQDTSYLTQTVSYLDNFQIEVNGYEGYCYDEHSVNRRYAVITPVFSVTRLRDSDETEVDFNFYTETVKGPPGFLGKKSYAAGTSIGLDEQSKEFRGKPVKVKIPADGTPLEIILSLDVSRDEYRYNQRTFNVERRQENKDEHFFIESGLVRYIPASKKAAPAEQPQENPSSSCNSCGI